MNKHYQLKHFLLGCGLLLCIDLGHAISLGPLQGAAWLGQSLQVSSKLEISAEEDFSTSCLETEVFYGDNRISAEQVTLQQVAGIGNSAYTVTIRSSVVIDEPVVTVYLRAGCAQKISRRYVLLAEVANDTGNNLNLISGVNPSRLTPRLDSPSAEPTVQVTLVEGARAESSSGQSSRGVRALVSSSIQGSSSVATGKKVSPEVKLMPLKPGGAAPGPRLKLDFSDQTPAHLSLKPSGNLASVPLDIDPRRAQAQTAWKAISQDPLDAAAADVATRKSLESEIRQLQEAVRVVQNTNRELGQRLQSAESDRYPNGLFYLLLGLLIAMGGLLAYLWRSRAMGRSNDWWRGETVQDAETAPVLKPVATALEAESVQAPQDLILTALMSSQTSTKSESDAVGALAISPAPGVVMQDLTSGLSASGREVNAEELFDIQQQADFFKSLGQYDQAISLLVAHIQESADTSPLVYLDLLAIYHMLHRTEEYAQLRADFNKAFNAKVPPIESFDTHSEGLESYERALSRVESLWNTPKVLEVLEESVFRRPAQGDDRPFDLEAYRELLMLHGIAKEVLSDTDSGRVELDDANPADDAQWDSGRSGVFSDTSIQPLQAFRGEFGDVPEKPGLMGYGRLALDIDLSQPPGIELGADDVASPADDWHSPALDHVKGRFALDDSGLPMSEPVQDSMPMLDFDLGEDMTLTSVALGETDGDAPKPH